MSTHFCALLTTLSKLTLIALFSFTIAACAKSESAKPTGEKANFTPAATPQPPATSNPPATPAAPKEPTPGPAVTATPAPAATTPELMSAFQDQQIQFRVKSAELLQKAFSEKTLALVKGKLTTSDALKSALARGEVACTIDALLPEMPDLVAGSTMKITGRTEFALTSAPRQFNAVTDAKLGLGCVKSKNEPYNLVELRAALKGVLDIVIKP